MMLDLFKAKISKFLISASGEKHLLAVSGGLDSMVMLHLALHAGLEIGVAHVDHGTRAGKSTIDAAFVRNYCEEQGIPFHLAKIEDNTLRGNNFQSEAREFRYDFFNIIADKSGYDLIWTAHHQTDRWETIIYNLSRAAGLDGLSSLRFAQGNVRRPLLSFSRSELEEYAHHYKIAYQHDDSNDGDAYVRNKIRHHITPAVESVFPNIVEAAAQAANYLEVERDLLIELLHDGNFMGTTDGFLSVDLRRVKSFASAPLLLFRLVNNYGFSRADCADMLTAGTGAYFTASDYEALVDRSVLLIRKVGVTTDVEIQISQQGTYTLSDGRQLQVSDVGEDHLSVSEELLNGGVTVRNWKDGDTFQPSGMGGKKKKLKKYLTDKKMSRWAKDQILVIEKAGRIIQVVGHRNSEEANSLNKGDSLVYFTVLQ